MDVTCERCNTEYEFDDTLLSPRGTTVKCTNCSHVFRVFPAGVRAGSESKASWKLRRQNGTVESVESLRTLQKWIAHGGVSPNDEISRDGTTFKRLGEIGELESFFAAAAPRPRITHTPPMGTPLPSAEPLPAVPTEVTRVARLLPGQGAPGSPSERPTPSSRPRGGNGAGTVGYDERRADETWADPGLGVRRPAAPSLQVVTTPSTMPPPGPGGVVVTATVPPPGGESAYSAFANDTVREPEEDVSSDPLQASRAGLATVRARPTSSELPPQHVSWAPERQQEPSGGFGQLYLDADDERERYVQPKRRGVRWVLLLVLALGVAGASIFAWPDVARWLHLHKAPPSDTGVTAQAEQTLAQDTYEGYAKAVALFERGLSKQGRAGSLLTGAARAHAAWAQALTFEASDLDALSATDPSRKVQAERLRQEAKVHAEKARVLADEAKRDDPGSFEAELELSDSLRLLGRIDEARAHFDRAQSMKPQLTAQGYRIAAIVTAAESGTGLGPAKELAEKAVQKDPASIRNRLLLARVSLARSEIAAARVHVGVVLQTNGAHPFALFLKDAMDKGLPPAAPVVAVPDAGMMAPSDSNGVPAGSVPQGPSPSAPSTGVPQPSTPTKGGGQPVEAHHGGGSATPPPRDYRALIVQGNSAIQKNLLTQAEAHFRAALAARPGAAEAEYGLGQVSLAQKNYQAAIGYFDSASAAGFAEALLGLGDVYRRMGRTGDAIEAYQQYLARLPSGSKAGFAKKAIEALRGPSPSTSTGPKDPSSSSTPDSSSSGGGATVPSKPPESGGPEGSPAKEPPLPSKESTGDYGI